MTTAWNPWYQSTPEPTHEAEVYWGDWNVYAYCKTQGCGWESVHTNHYYANSARHWDQARKHTKRMNSWWRRLWRLLIRNRPAPETKEQ